MIVHTNEIKEMVPIHEATKSNPEGHCKARDTFEFLITLAGGRIRCARCNALSKRTKQQCRAPAMKGKTKCRFHGGKSTGPKTPAGRQRIAQAQTIHGHETRQIRHERQKVLLRLAELEDLMYALKMTNAPRTRGRKPKGY
jgi:hypothetical protein